MGPSRVVAAVVIVLVLGTAGCRSGTPPEARSAPPTYPVAPCTSHAVGARGLPSCGTYVGMAYGSNSDLAPVEDALGRTIALHRTFWRASQVEVAAQTATADVAAGRLPWVSFKTPLPWPQMASGEGDAWVRDLQSQMAKVPGPVWVTVSHEPENDGGDLQDWRLMQERIGPELRQAPNIGFAVILMGYHQLFGKPRFAFDRIWPDTKVDMVGFDVYNWWGTYKDGVLDTNHVDLDTKYFQRLAAWADQQGVPWGIAETGYTDYADARDPDWLERTYTQVKDRGGVAFTYFNTDLNSRGNTWELNPEKLAKYRGVLRSSPRIT